MVGWIGSTSPREHDYSLMVSLKHAMDDEESMKKERNRLEMFYYYKGESSPKITRKTKLKIVYQIIYCLVLLSPIYK